MDDLFQQLFQCAKRFDQAVDLTLPCLLGEEDQKISFRHWAAGKLQEKLFGVAKSLSKLIKVSAEVELNEINAHSQSILALSRVLTELCNKLAYLALDPKDDNELRLRTLYFSLVGAVRYKEKLETISDPSGNLAAHQEQLKKISEKIDDRKSRLQEAGFEDWEAFKRENPKIQTLLREGRTAEDYLKKDFDSFLSRRLKPKEKRHYQLLGNSAVHSNAFVVNFYNRSEDNDAFVSGVACLTLFDAAKHLALCTLETVERFRELAGRLDETANKTLVELAKSIARESYDLDKVTSDQSRPLAQKQPMPSETLTAVDYEAVIGLEVHCQLKTNTKMFCGCKNEFGGATNSHTCPVCLGLPGVLPVPNAEAIVKTLLTGEMLGCQIATRCKFDRKNYFYPDMPKNYQISQYDEPLCAGGHVTLDLLAYPKDAQKEASTVADKPIRLVRIHLEEDVAKSFHFDDGTSGIDFNRAGTPLMEIVSEADMASPEEAFAYLSALKQILVYGGVSDADMEKGQMRCDVNISIRPKGQTEFGTKCELKNLNSISGVRRALKYEIARQIDVVTSGGKIEQQTRRWDDDKGETTLMRVKEKAHDYRYFPDPDIQPLRTDEGLYDEAQKRMPELPKAKKVRLVDTYGVSAYQAGVLASDSSLANYFEEAAKAKPQNGAAVANFLLNDFLATATEGASVPHVVPDFFAELAELSSSGQINSKQAKDVFSKMIAENKSPVLLVKELGLSQVSDVGALEAFADQAIAANPKSVADYKAGKQAALNALKGQVMKLSKGTANPQLVGEIIAKKLSG